MLLDIATDGNFATCDKIGECKRIYNSVFHVNYMYLRCHRKEKTHMHASIARRDGDDVIACRLESIFPSSSSSSVLLTTTTVSSYVLAN